MIGAASRTSAHMARAVWPWSSDTALARRASRRPGRRHVERVAAELAQLGGDELAAGAEAQEVGERVDLVAGRDRGVGGEDDARPRRAPGGLEARPGLHLGRDQLDAREDGVALVEVVGAHLRVKEPQGARARRCRAASPGRCGSRAGVVEPARDPAVARVGRLEQVERHDRVAAHAPHAALDAAAGHADPDAHAGVVEEVRAVLVPLVDGLGRRRRCAAPCSPRPSGARRRRRGSPRSWAALMKSPARMPRPPE